MRSLYAELMVVTTAALAVAVGISLWFLYALSAATVRSSTAARLERAVAAATRAVQTQGGPGLSAVYRAEASAVGGTLEMVDGQGHVYWVGGAPYAVGSVRHDLTIALGKVRLGRQAAVAASGPVRIPGLRTGLFVLWIAPYRVPVFPNREETDVLVSGLCAIALAQVLWALVARRLTRPVAELSALLERYGQGDFAARSTVRGPREFAQLQEAMTQMAQQLAAERAARETFLAEVAHDLRTPLTALRGLLASLEIGAHNADADRLARAQREAERLSRLVNDLLDLARYEAGHLQVEVRPVDVREIALLGITAGEALAAQRGIRFDVHLPETPVRALADLDRGAQILVNLVDNALRYTPYGGTVQVSVLDGDDGPAIRVEDTGPGFEPGATQWVFSAFARGKAARENDGGTGLGLAIGRALAQAMGGSLRILPPLERGFRGRVELVLPSVERGRPAAALHGAAEPTA